MGPERKLTISLALTLAPAPNMVSGSTVAVQGIEITGEDHFPLPPSLLSLSPSPTLGAGTAHRALPNVILSLSSHQSS